MKRALLTGMSGTGKSSVIQALIARGSYGVDLDTPEWSHWVETGQSDPDEAADSRWRERDWMWREDRVRRLLSSPPAPGQDVLFISGCASNQGQFYRLLEHVILLSAPAAVIAGRLASRTNNTYGKSAAELGRVLGHIRTVEPLLRRRATLEIDTSMPLDQVVETVLAHVHELPA